MYKLVNMGACLNVHFTCNLVMEKCCPCKPTSLHTNWVILLMGLFTNMFVHKINAHVGFCGCSADPDEKLVPAVLVTGSISGNYSAL